MEPLSQFDKVEMELLSALGDVILGVRLGLQDVAGRGKEVHLTARSESHQPEVGQQIRCLNPAKLKEFRLKAVQERKVLLKKTF